MSIRMAALRTLPRAAFSTPRLAREVSNLHLIGTDYRMVAIGHPMKLRGRFGLGVGKRGTVPLP
jgi:hypothetical protein